MSRLDRSHRICALAIFALAQAAWCGLVAQTTAPAQAPATPTQSVSPPATQPPSAPSTPAANPPADAIVVPGLAPGMQPTPEQLGDSLSAHQRYQAAIAAYARIPAPTASVWNKMGIAYQMMFNLKDATRCYNASIKLDPKNATVLNNLATVYDSLKQYGIAERYYRKALKLDPRSALILRNLGSNQLAQHRYKKGWEAYQSALAIDPQIFQNRSGASVENPATTQERGAMHYYMAKGCVSTGNPDCAIQNLRLAINEGYTNPKKIASDGSFASLHELPAFQQMIAAQTAQ